MADISNLSNFLTDVAKAIKTKKGSKTAIPAANFDKEILSIKTSTGAKLFNTKTEMNNSTGNAEGDLAIVYRNQRTFDGIYIYKNNNWELAPTQLTATSDYVYKQSFYGKNGIETGTLAQNASNSFNDNNAKIYAKIQSLYDNMQPRVLTDSDKTINKNIFIIPVKSDGTPLLDTSKVTNMNNVLNNCKNLITIPLLDTSNVTNMNAMFLFCGNLTTIPLLNTSKVTNMGGMFNYCASLTTIPLLDTSNVIYMHSMFEYCPNLIMIPLLDTSNVIHMSNMFSGCTKLTTIPQLNTSKVTNMSNMFHYCSNLTTIPELNTSKVTDMSGMFSNCTNLTTIPLLDTSSVTNMFGMFSTCSKLTTIPELNTSNVTDMASMLLNCSNLTTIPLLDTSKVTNMQNMFNSCLNLTTIPLLDTSSVTDMEGMFYRCTNLSDDSLNIIMQMCINATSYTKTKTLKALELTQEQADKCKTLSNYSAFTSAGWTIGY